jgi:cytochrome c biogenesis protein CcmG/thiol:disulfide interchange protein DsbE
MRQLAFALPLLLFAAVAVWMAVPLIRGDDPSVLPSALIDRPAPDFDLPALPDVPGGLATSDLQGGNPAGSVRLVNFFASWCVPCLAEHPLLTRLAREEGIPLFGVNYKDPTDAATAWLDRHGNPYELVGADTDGRTAIDWGVYGVPETFVVDGEGHIRFRHAGPLTPDIVRTQILPLIRDLSK